MLVHLHSLIIAHSGAGRGISDGRLHQLGEQHADNQATDDDVGVLSDQRAGTGEVRFLLAERIAMGHTECRPVRLLGTVISSRMDFAMRVPSCGQGISWSGS